MVCDKGATLISTYHSKESTNAPKEHVEFFATVSCGCRYKAQKCTVERAIIAGRINAHEDS